MDIGSWWSERRARVARMDPVLAWPGALFVMISVSVVVDLADDVAHGVSSFHVATEFAALLLALGGTVGIAWQLRKAQLANLFLRHDLEGTRADLSRWRADALDLQRGLGRAIHQQFVEWGLTAPEREVALYILKGVSYQHIACSRHTSARLARQQAIAIYRKAGVAGRAEMAAYFVQDLLLPRDVISVPLTRSEGSGAGARVISLAGRLEEQPGSKRSPVTVDENG